MALKEEVASILMDMMSNEKKLAHQSTVENICKNLMEGML